MIQKLKQTEQSALSRQGERDWEFVCLENCLILALIDTTRQFSNVVVKKAGWRLLRT